MIRARALAALWALWLSGCSCDGGTTAAGAPSAGAATPSAASAPSPAEAHPTEAAPEPPIDIGWDHVPSDPDRAAREANAAALRIHGHALGAGEDEARRVWQGSLLAFERVVEASPDYLNARFNVACALCRLGRSEEALSILRELLRIDLPSFAPRLDADPDLGPLASAPGWQELVAYRRSLEARWDEALAAGVPVVHVTPRETIPAGDEDAAERVRLTMQAGVWLAPEGRFVPMAPRIVREVDALVLSLTLGATVVDRAHRAVLSFEGEGSWSEGGGPIGGGTFVVHDAGRGTERARFSSGRDGPSFCPLIVFHATDDGGAIAFRVETPDGDVVERTRVLGSGVLDGAVRPALAVNFAHATVLLPTWAPGGLTVDGGVVRLGPGSAEAALPPEHHVPREVGARVVRWAPRDEHSDWLLTAAIEHVEWDSYSAVRPALSLVGVASGSLTVQLVLSARTGIGALVSTEREAYAQIGDALYRLTAGTEPERLPEGLVLVPSEPHLY